jgi:hypothetical protein
MISRKTPTRRTYGTLFHHLFNATDKMSLRDMKRPIILYSLFDVRYSLRQSLCFDWHCYVYVDMSKGLAAMKFTWAHGPTDKIPYGT